VGRGPLLEQFHLVAAPLEGVGRSHDVQHSFFLLGCERPGLSDLFQDSVCH